jgi:integrase
MVLLRMFFKAAKLENLREICVMKQRTKRLSPDDILTLPEVQRMVDAAASLRDKALIACLWETGVRIHELLALDLKDLKVRDSPENGGKRMYVVWFKKVKVAGEEHGGLIVEAAPVLEMWLKAHPNPRPDAPLFSAWGGARLGIDGAEKIVKDSAKRAGIVKRVYCHLLRHSRATHLLRIGVPEMQVKKLLGWKSNSILLSRYAHLVDQDAYDAILKAQGYEVPKPQDVGKLVFEDDKLKPVVPMVPPPGVSVTSEQNQRVDELLERINRLERAVERAAVGKFEELGAHTAAEELRRLGEAGSRHR